MLRLLAPLEALMILFQILANYPSVVSVLPSQPYLVFSLTTLQQSYFLGLKELGEAFSYAYYKSVESSFDANDYSDDPNENWTPPSFFEDPPGGKEVNCAAYDGRLGCVVWNLTGGDINDPCPNVVVYSPNPIPNISPNVDRDDVEGYFSQLEVVLERNIGSLGFNVSNSITGLTISWVGGSYDVRGTLNYSGSSEILSKTESVDFRWIFTPHTTETNYVGAYCECDYGSGYQRVASYTLRRIGFGLEGRVGGETLLEENSGVPYLRYFIGVDKNYPSGGSPIRCRMVVE